MSESAAPLSVEMADGLLTLTFNRPETLNAIDLSVVTAINDALDAHGDEARVVILTGTGRAFCSGADLSGKGKADDEGGESKAKGLGLEYINDTMRRLANLDALVIAAVNGPAAGVGTSFALVADYVIMGEGSYFMLAFNKIGLMPDGGATQLVAASAGRHRAMRMALTAEKVPAETAGEWGLASEVVADAAARAREVAAGFVVGPPLSLVKTKAAINAATLGEFSPALDRELEGQKELRDSADFAEGVAAFLEKRPAVFTGR